MEEFESQTEHVEEHLHHHAEHAPEKWIMGVALTAALLAAMAAVAALLSGHYVDDAMLDRIKSSDHWNEFQAKGIKSAIVLSRIDAHTLHDKPEDARDRERLSRYEEEQKELKRDAEGEEKSSDLHFRRHTVLSRGVTLFQVAIAVSAISALTRRRVFWFVGIGLGCIGIYFLVTGLMPMNTPG